MNYTPIDSKNAGLRNEKLVISLLTQHGELSQAQLCELAGLSSSTASYIVGRLREKGLINEKRGQSSKRGARPVLVSVRPRAQLVVGAEVNPRYIHVGLFDFHCEPIESLKAAVGEDHSPETVADLLEINLRGLLGKHGVTEEKLVGIGVTLSGAISMDGVVGRSKPMGWEDVPFRGMLQKRFQATVHVYTTRVRMFAEISLLPLTAAKNLVLLNFGNGVGASVAVDGQLMKGATNRAGEVGHILVDPDGPPCTCGRRGCLETFVSGPALAARIRSDLANGTETILRQHVTDEDTAEEVLNHLGRAIAEEDPYALKIRELIAEHVSRTAAIVVSCYDPEVLVLGGYVSAQCPDYLLEHIKETIAADVLDTHARDLTLIPARAGEQALVRGIATAVLRNTMEEL
jgi:N-acetylglucosamine repressor